MSARAPLGAGVIGSALEALGEAPEHLALCVVSPDAVLASRGEPDEVFALASVTKLLSAYATLVALEEGSVALDDPAGPPGSTLAHLLAHASGISPDDPARVLAAPGTRRIYSSAGFALLAGHVAERTGMEFSRYASEAVCEPLGMGRTDVSGSPGAGATSSVGDLARFCGELLAPRLIDPATLARARSVAFPGLAGVLPGFGRQDPCDFGLGFEIKDHKAPHWTGRANSPATFGHFGQSGTFIWVDPVVRVALVLLSDRPFEEWDPRSWPALADVVLGALETA